MENFAAENSVTEGQLSAFVGKNYAYYQDKWAKINAGNNVMSWNFAAFFLGVVWIIYRKMYLYAAVIIAVVVSESLAEYYFNAPAALSYAITVAMYLAYGFYANYLYKIHANKKIAEINLNTPQQIEAELAKQGGTSLPAALGFVIATLAIIGYTFFALEPSAAA